MIVEGNANRQRKHRYSLNFTGYLADLPVGVNPTRTVAMLLFQITVGMTLVHKITSVIGISQWNGQGNRSVYAFRVNGKILVESSSAIGNDASGQDNHFNDENFAGRQNQMRFGAQLLTSKNGWFSSNRNNKAAFNGSSSAATSDKQGEITFSCNLQNVSTIGFIIDVDNWYYCYW